jgi:alpha-tubulin suppressor-like RCC1 family protein
MTKLLRVLFPVNILVIPIIIIWNSCSKDNNPLCDECSIVIENNLLGKFKSDLGNNAILKPDSTLWTWGMNLTGQLGNGTMESSNIPLKVPSIEEIVDFDMDGGMAIAVDRTGNIWFWGTNALSSILWPEILSPVKCSFLDDTKAIELGTYMLRNDGTVWQINIGPDVESTFYEPEIISNLDQIVSISQSLALRKNCTLCELKSYEPEHGGLVPVNDVIAVQNVINRRTVILKKDGTVWAWGQNGYGQLGNGSNEHSAIPVKVSNLNNIIQISANYDFNLALKEDGTVWFWGFICKWDENHNPIGINIPERINNLDNVALIYAGLTCLVMKNDGSYWYFNSEDRIPQLVSFK